MVDDDMLDKVLDKITKIVGIEKFDSLMTLIDTNDKLPDDITLISALILMKCVMKDGGKYYLQIFLEKLLYVWYIRHPTRMWGLCFPEREKEEIRNHFTNKVGT